MRRVDRSKIKSQLVWGSAAVSAVVLLLLAAIPMDTLSGLPLVCPFKRFFGIDCYGCGMTRALSAFLHGHVQTALALNRGVLLVLPLLAFIALLPAGVAGRGSPKSRGSPQKC